MELLTHALPVHVGAHREEGCGLYGCPDTGGIVIRLPGKRFLVRDSGLGVVNNKVGLVQSVK